MHRAAHITVAAVVEKKFSGAVEEFCNPEGVAIFQIDARGHFAIKHATLRDAPAIIGRDNDALVAMRSSRKFVFLSDRGHSLPGEIAIPLMVRGAVNGLVLVGAKQGGQQYRPGEIALLETCVQQIGLDLEGLRAVELHSRAMSSESQADRLEQWLADLERTCAAQEHALRLRAEREVSP